MSLPPGLHHLDPADYHRDPAERPSLSATLAKLLVARSPLHAWTASPRLNPAWQPTNSRVFDVGRAAHRAVLGKGDDYCVWPDEVLDARGGATTKAAKEWEADARASGLTPLKAADLEAVMAMKQSVQARLRGVGIVIDATHSEVTALGEIDGTMVRAMVDYAPPGKPWLLDLKTCEDASPEACVRSIARYGYDVQAAHYAETWEAATGQRRRMRFVFVEKAPPFEVTVAELHDAEGDEADWMADARGKTWHARQLWRACLDAGHWPGFPARIAVLGAPGHYRAAWERQGVEPEPRAASTEALRASYAAQAPERVT